MINFWSPGGDLRFARLTAVIYGRKSGRLLRMTDGRSTQVELIETKSNGESVIEFKAVFDRRPVNSGPVFGGSTVFVID